VRLVEGGSVACRQWQLAMTRPTQSDVWHEHDTCDEAGPRGYSPCGYCCTGLGVSCMHGRSLSAVTSVSCQNSELNSTHTMPDPEV